MELQDLKSIKSEPKKTYLYSDAESPSLISNILFFWIYPLLKLSESVTIEKEHTYPLPEIEKVENEILSSYLNKHKLFYSLLKSQ